MSERNWSVLFACSVGVLMLALLLVRSDPAPGWVLVVYPLIGALLGFAASRTSPSADQLAWIETGAIAAAAVIVFAAAVNVFLALVLLAGEIAEQTVVTSARVAIAVLLWWALQRRLSQLRPSESDRRAGHTRIPAE